LIGSTTTGTRAIRDNDRDGVVNIIDCKPNNPNKQGWIHKVGAKVARKFGRKGTAEKIEAAGERADVAKITRERERERIAGRVAVATRTEREKQAIETAIYKEKRRGESQRSYIKGGGFMGQLGRGVSQLGITKKGKRKRYKPLDLSYINKPIFK